MGDGLGDIGLVAQGVIEAPVIVGVHSVDSTRIGDLMPQKVCDYNRVLADSLRAFFPEIKMRGDAYASFVATTLKELVDSTYAVRTDMESTSVMGLKHGRTDVSLHHERVSRHIRRRGMPLDPLGGDA